MIEVAPVARTEVDWQVLLPGAASALGRSISFSTDKAGWSVLDVATFVAVAGELAVPNTVPSAALADGNALRHASMSFLLLAPAKVLFKFGMVGSVHLSLAEDAGNLALASGDLEAWRDTLVKLLTKDASAEMRELCVKLVACLEKAGMGNVFLAHEKVYTPDRLYYLEAK